MNIWIEPGDENALLRHVVYIIGLPKEIQNETLAEVFGGVCGPIAPVGRFVVSGFGLIIIWFRWMFVHLNRKFGCIKIVKHVKVKEKQQLHLSILNHVKRRSVILMVSNSIYFSIDFLFLL